MRFSDYSRQVVSELDRTLSGIDDAQVDSLVELIHRAKRVFVAGAGRSGFMARGFAMRLMHMGIPTYVVGETTTPSIGSEDALIIASGSGETGSLVSMAGKAKKIGSKLGLVTIFSNSTIGKAADAVVAIPAPTPKGADNGLTSVQPMGSLFEQSMLLTFDTIIMLLMNRRGQTSGEMFKNHANLE